MKAVYSIVGFFVFIVFIIVAISLSGNIADNSTASVSSVSKQVSIKSADYSNSNSEAVVVITGPVTADENHYSIRMKISSGLRSLEVLKGYQGKVDKLKSYPNNPSAYDAFLKALDGVYFSAERSTAKDVQANESSACTGGIRYALDLNTLSSVVFHRWTSNCSSQKGTFAGDIEQVLNVFRAQFPDYSETVSGASIY